MKKQWIRICLIAAALTGLCVSAGAADYTFTTGPDPDYYKSTNYVDLYDAEYRFGRVNQIDYDLPAIRYGLSEAFRENASVDPYFGSTIHFGPSSAGSSSLGSAGSLIGSGSTIEVVYTPQLTLSDMLRSDGSIGTIQIPRVGLKAKVYEGATDSSMSRGAGHYSGTGLYTGNIGLFGHNRGTGAYFARLKDVRIGDRVTYQTNQGTKTYEVQFVGTIASTDFSYLNETGDNRITMITCIANQPSLRLCVQAVEI